MEIPTLIAEAINPGLNNYVERSVVYTFNKLSAYDATDTHYIFRFPYSANTFWTNYKYVIYAPDKSSYNPLNIGVKAKLADVDQSHILVPTLERDANEWYDTHWPIPSVRPNNDSYIYFEVSKTPDEFRISLLGFIDLFPTSHSYMCLSRPPNRLLPLRLEDVDNVDEEEEEEEEYVNRIMFTKSDSEQEADVIQYPRDIDANTVYIKPLRAYGGV
jgi:hypothetical protein